MNLFFDLDDTILCFEAEEYVAIKKAFIEFGIEPTEQNIATYRKINRALWDKVGVSVAEHVEVRVSRFRQLFEVIDCKLSPEDAAKIYESKLCEGYAFMPGMPDCLEMLYGKHKLYLASNGIAHIQRSRTKNADLDKFFDQRFVSEDIGCEKPRVEYYERAFERIGGVDKSKTMMIGDNLRTDVMGANNVGILSCWYNPHGKENTTGVTPTYEIRSFSELFDIIKAIENS